MARRPVRAGVRTSLLLAGALLTAGCTAAAPPEPTPAPTQAPTPAPTAQPTPEPTPMPDNWHTVETASDDAVTLAFTGDWNFADDWAIVENFAASGRSFAENFSEDLLARMRGADLLVCNNEFSISDRGAPLAGKQFTFRASPSSAAYWHEVGADLLCLANNHAGDYGLDALTDTLDILHGEGLPTFGAGRNLEEAAQTQYFTANGMTFAFVAATRAEKYILTPQATEDSPGVLYCYDDSDLLQALRTAADKADFVVAYLHWGTEESTVLETAQLDLATACAEAGADLIVGSHPHVLQGAGWRGDVPVFYSLGNFWFNMDTDTTALLTVTVRSPEDFTCQVLPCLQSGGTTRLLDGEEAAGVLDSLNRISESGAFLDETGVLCSEPVTEPPA